MLIIHQSCHELLAGEAGPWIGSSPVLMGTTILAKIFAENRGSRWATRTAKIDCRVSFKGIVLHTLK